CARRSYGYGITFYYFDYW
nr:immunoglobulin heavy chain junction region [Mus musculus]MBK4197511.1 immunoglobulin heavy chain junction region [Mus musculus]